MTVNFDADYRRPSYNVFTNFESNAGTTSA